MITAKEIAARCYSDKETQFVPFDESLVKAIEKRVSILLDKIKQLQDREESAWGLIANAYGGDWDLANNNWKTAAKRWRYDYPLKPVSIS